MSINPTLEERVTALEQLASADSIQSNLYSVGANGLINAISLPVSPFSSQIQWVRQSDGAVVADIVEQNFGTAPNRQQRLQLQAQEPVDAGANAGADIEVIAGGSSGSISRELLGWFPGIYGTFAKSDWLLQERLMFTVWGFGAPSGFVIDTNFRIYDLGGGVQFQNSSISGDSPWVTAGRFTVPRTGGFVLWSASYGGSSSNSIASGISKNAGAYVPPMCEVAPIFASSPSNAHASNISFVRSVAGDVWEWSGWNNTVTPSCCIGVLGIPFDQSQL